MKLLERTGPKKSVTKPMVRPTPIRISKRTAIHRTSRKMHSPKFASRKQSPRVAACHVDTTVVAFAKAAGG